MSKQYPTAYVGYLVVVPSKNNVVVPSKNNAVSKQRGQSTGKYEMTSRKNTYDKQSGSYLRKTSKASYSSGDYSNRGKTGHKAEYKASSTVRVGDKGGYTEYYKQEKVTRVNYDNGSGSKSGGSKGYGGGKKYLH